MKNVVNNSNDLFIEKRYKKELKKQEKRHKKELAKQEREFRKRLEKELLRERRKWSAQIQGEKRKRARAETVREIRENHNGWEEEVSSNSEEIKKFYPQGIKTVRKGHNGKAVDYVIDNFVSIHPEKFLDQSKEALLKFWTHL